MQQQQQQQQQTELRFFIFLSRFLVLGRLLLPARKDSPAGGCCYNLFVTKRSRNLPEVALWEEEEEEEEKKGKLQFQLWNEEKKEKLYNELCVCVCLYQQKQQQQQHNVVKIVITYEER